MNFINLSNSVPGIKKKFYPLEENAEKTLSIDQQIELIKQKALENISMGKISEMKHLIEVSLINPSNHRKLVKAIKKSSSAASVLQNSYNLLQKSEITLSLATLINELGESGLNKTDLFNNIVFDYLISPLINNSDIKLDTLAKLFSKNQYSTLSFSFEVKKSYQSISDLLCPVTSHEFKPLIKITFEEVTYNLRLFMDMSKILSCEAQGEFFDFVNELPLKKTKDDFIELVQLSQININDAEKLQILDAIKIAFESERANLKNLNATIIKLLSNNITNIWLGMKWTYLECLQKNEARNVKEKV